MRKEVRQMKWRKKETFSARHKRDERNEALKGKLQHAEVSSTGEKPYPAPPGMKGRNEGESIDRGRENATRRRGVQRIRYDKEPLFFD